MNEEWGTTTHCTVLVFYLKQHGVRTLNWVLWETQGSKTHHLFQTDLAYSHLFKLSSALLYSHTQMLSKHGHKHHGEIPSPQHLLETIWNIFRIIPFSPQVIIPTNFSLLLRWDQRVCVLPLIVFWFNPCGTVEIWARAIRTSQELALSAGDSRAPSAASYRSEVVLVTHNLHWKHYDISLGRKIRHRWSILHSYPWLQTNVSSKRAARARGFFFHVTTSRARAELFPGCISALSKPSSSDKQLPVSSK